MRDMLPLVGRAVVEENDCIVSGEPAICQSVDQSLLTRNERFAFPDVALRQLQGGLARRHSTSNIAL
jgi:hypothetical protein